MAKKITTIIISVLLVIVSILGGVYTAKLSVAPFEKLETGDEIVSVMPDDDGKVKINVLIMGLDKDKTRTDTMLMASYDEKRQKISVMSIPRDVYVTVDGGRMLINTVYAYKGPEGTIQEVKELTGMPVNYYVVFTFDDFRKIIDALGGVEFDVRPQGYYYEDPYQDLVIAIPGGHQLLDGKNAEGLVRYRDDYARADLERVEVQQKFIKALIAQKLNTEYIKAVPKIYYAVKDSVKSNFSLNDILNYGQKMLEVDFSSIYTATLPTELNGAHLNALMPEIDALIETQFDFDGPIEGRQQIDSTPEVTEQIDD